MTEPSTKAVFSAALAKLRQEAGFRSAYQFYHDNGGRRQFPFTFGHYLRIERGTILPRPAWVARLLTALRWMKAQHMVHMTPEQSEAVAADEAAYWCSEALCAQGGTWTAERKALPRLVKAKLARKSANGRYRSRYEGKVFTFPGRLEGMLPALERVQSFWERAAARTGKELMARVELVRADEGAMRGYAAALAETVEGAIANSTHDQGAGTGFFLVEARARKLKSF